MSSIITLTTDFGQSIYTGILKGVISSINSGLTIIDISHNVSKFNVSEAKFILENSYFYFPFRTVHLAVIDPGVGSERKSIVVKTEKYFFVGPDNGIFSFINRNEIEKIYEIITNNSRISNTFHGRDIFAPIAAKIASSHPVSDFLKEIEPRATFTFFSKSATIEYKVVYIDEFGNIILNLKKNHFLMSINDRGTKWILNYKNKKFDKLANNYFSVNKGEFLLLINSLGYLEISCREGNAAEQLKAAVGDEFSFRVYK